MILQTPNRKNYLKIQFKKVWIEDITDIEIFRLQYNPVLFKFLKILIKQKVILDKPIHTKKKKKSSKRREKDVFLKNYWIRFVLKV